MENNETETIAATTVETTSSNELIVRNPLFLIFAEYLGYESPLIEWAENWCNGKSIPKYQRSIIAVDALDVYHKMLVDYTNKELTAWYAEFYDVVLSDFELNLIRLELTEEDNKKLPF